MSKTEEVATKNQTSIVTPTKQEELPATIAQLKALLAEKRGTVDESVSLDIDYNGRNIKNIDSVKELIEISASINARAETYQKELARYNLLERNIAPFTQSDKSPAEWVKIIDKGINELINKVEITTLEETIKDFEDCLSAQDKMAAKIANNMAKMNNFIK